MSKILFDLSGKIDPLTVAALFAVKSIADSNNSPFFVVGASARDFIFKHCYGIEPRRLTTDIDLGVQVADWAHFHKLTEALRATGKFLPDERQNQRYHFESVLIDIVPFGPITDENQKIAWPPEHENFMSVVGFKEAYEYSITVRLSTTPELDIKLPTLPGLALMKIVSWNERYPVRTKDAEDILLIMNKYEAAGNSERLYEKEPELLQEEKFDTKLAGIRLLGRDMAKITDIETLRIVKDVSFTILPAAVLQAALRKAIGNGDSSNLRDSQISQVIRGWIIESRRTSRITLVARWHKDDHSLACTCE